MKRSPTVFIGLLLCLALAFPAAADPQLRGKALYDAWGKLEIAKTAGMTRVTWLPEGQGWLEAETDKKTSTTVFYKVDPRTQKKSRLFSPQVEKSMVDQFNRLAGKTVAGLPFSSFSYLPDDAGLYFSVGRGQDFVYFFKDKSLLKLERPAAAPAQFAPPIPPEFIRPSLPATRPISRSTPTPRITTSGSSTSPPRKKSR
jgi:hypothetical protein